MKRNTGGMLEHLAREALDLGADTLEVEYRGDHDEVVAYLGAVGREIARLRRGTAQATELRRDLYATKRRLLRFNVRGWEYRLRAQLYENFGEDAFRVELRAVARRTGRSNNEMQQTGGARRRPRGA